MTLDSLKRADRRSLLTARALRHLALLSGCDERTIRDALRGLRRPHPATRRAIEAALDLVLAARP